MGRMANVLPNITVQVKNTYLKNYKTIILRKVEFLLKKPTNYRFRAIQSTAELHLVNTIVVVSDQALFTTALNTI